MQALEIPHGFQASEQWHIGQSTEQQQGGQPNGEDRDQHEGRHHPRAEPLPQMEG
jgi:hypothetical protein